jgi:hypothetical protein
MTGRATDSCAAVEVIGHAALTDSSCCKAADGASMEAHSSIRVLRTLEIYWVFVWCFEGQSVAVPPERILDIERVDRGWRNARRSG